MPNWNSTLKKFGHQPHWLKGNQLAEGRLENGINLISTYTVQKYPLGPIIQERLHGRLSAVLIDEAHRGMIADEVLRRSLNSVCAVAEQRILVTATPMRTDRDDLFALIRSASSGTTDEPAAEIANQIYDLHEDFLFNTWLPLLVKMREDDLTIDEIRPSCRNTGGVFYLFLSRNFTSFKGCLMSLNRSSNHSTSSKRLSLPKTSILLAVLCCTLRDDLGRETCSSRFRTMKSRSLGYTLSDDYVNEMENILASVGSTNPRRLLAECLLNSTPEDEYPSRELPAKRRGSSTI